MTLLTICQKAADEISIDRPASVIGSADENVEKLERYANKVGERLMRAYAWQALRTEQTFTAIAGAVQTSILPADFNRFVPETFWDRTNVSLVSGPISAVEWQGLKANGYSDPARKFILRGGVVSVVPDFDGGESLAFEYVSKNWCESSGGTGQAAWAADTDVGVIDEELIALGVIYEFLAGEGLPTAAAAQSYTEAFDQLVANDQPSSGVMVSADIFGGGRHFTGTPPVSGSASIL